MNKYLFINTSDKNFEQANIVFAKNKSEALKIFCYNRKIPDQDITNIHDKEDVFYFGEKFYPEDSTSDDEFKKNVKSYFPTNTNYADLFINQFFNTIKSYIFPRDMLGYILLKEFDERDWIILDLNQIKEISHGSEISGDQSRCNDLRKDKDNLSE